MTTTSYRLQQLLLLVGDVLFFYLALWLTLLARYSGIPSEMILKEHLFPFSLLFVAWVIVYYLSGLYDKKIIFFGGKLPGIILNAQIINIIVAALFFFAVTFFPIAPKTNLIIYLIISFGLIVGWRLYLAPFVGIQRIQRLILVGSGKDVEKLYREAHKNHNYRLRFVKKIDPEKSSPEELVLKIKKTVKNQGVRSVVIDLNHEAAREAAPQLYQLIFSGVQFIELEKVYEDFFDRLPVSLLPYHWLVSNLSIAPKLLYDLLKRTMDITLATILGVLSLPLYPVIIAAMLLEGWGSVFIVQDRLGQHGSTIKLVKFRTMTGDDSGENVLESSLEVTKVGEILRKLRLDELPQIWNVFLGDLSFVGPRPELPALTELYAKEVPYYHLRHLIKPGLSGWAQIHHKEHPHHGVAIEETKNKLSYDLYYVKERSLFLDLHVAFQTIKIILSRAGS